ncbi:MAG: cytochrome c [Hyphomicrobiales bacterium]|nr:cytochrome c [Hyphomicrobiales bacterium]MCP5372008.1 cytochrome c [Hyphomicrobiales bacterium]
MTRANLAVAAVAVAALGVVGGAYVWAILGGPGGPDPDNPRVVARGQAVYADTCAQCHGANLEGEPDWRRRKADGTLPAPPHDASGHTWHHGDDLLFKVTRDGGASIAPEGFKSAMPAFGETLSDADIWAALSFIKSRWPPAIRHHQERLGGQTR